MTRANSIFRDGTLKLWSCGQGKCLEPSVAIGDVINCCDIINIEGLDEFTFPPFNKTVDDQESTDFDPTCIGKWKVLPYHVVFAIRI